MSKKMTDDELHQHLQLARTYLDEYLTELEGGSPDQKKKAALLGYWVGDYINFLRKESTFDSRKLIRYKRGSIVKAHLGYRVGSEEGGLHFAVVLDVNNTQASPVVTVVPLTSVKKQTDINKLHPSNVFLGDEIYSALKQKYNKTLAFYEQEFLRISAELDKLKDSIPSVDNPDRDEISVSVLNSFIEPASQLLALKEKIGLLDDVEKELGRMKEGSIALVGQITTISKIRIRNPLYPSDSFSNIRLTDATLNKLDEKVKELFTCSK